MRIIATTILMILILSLLLLSGCEKEKIVNTTETIREIEYVDVPGGTVVRVDTVFVNGQGADTVTVYDTTFQTTTDTVFVTDTVGSSSCSPVEQFAFAAMQYQTDPQVIEMVNAEFGLTEGWIYYLSEFQSDITVVSAGTFEIYGYIDFWTTDWSGYFPIEYLWRMTYTSGDPADPNSWQMSEPAGPVSGHPPGLHLVKDANRAR